MTNRPPPSALDDFTITEYKKKFKLPIGPDIKQLVPILAWLPTYNVRKHLRYDLVAGLTMAVMTIPQGMAYASLAALPPVYGLYAAFVPLYIYAIFGSSRELSLGMVAVNSLLIASTLKDIKDPNEYIDAALVLTFITGVVSLGMGVLRLGVIVQFLSPSVLLGFISGSAAIIILSQIEGLFGVKGEKSDYSIIQIINILSVLGDTKWISVLSGLGCLGILQVVAWYNKRLPGALIVTVISSITALLVHKFTDLDGLYPIIGKVPSGLPGFYAPKNWSVDGNMIFSALILAFLGFLQSVSVILKFEQDQLTPEQEKERDGDPLYQVKSDPNQELIALGLMHMIGSFFGSPDSTGGFSRSAVNHSVGGRSQLMSIITATVILIALVGLTPAFYYIPKSTLSAIVISSVASLLSFSSFIELWRRKQHVDLVIALVTFLGTFLSTVIIGLSVGVGLSILYILYKKGNSTVSTLSFNESTRLWKARSSKYEENSTLKGLVVLGFPSWMWYANYQSIMAKLKRCNAIQRGTRVVVCDLGSVELLDSKGFEVITKMLQMAKKSDVIVLFASAKDDVKQAIWRLADADFRESIPLEVVQIERQKSIDSCAFVRRNTDDVEDGGNMIPLEHFGSDAYLRQQVQTEVTESPSSSAFNLQPGVLTKQLFFVSVDAAVSFAKDLIRSSQL